MRGGKLARLLAAMTAAMVSLVVAVEPAAAETPDRAAEAPSQPVVRAALNGVEFDMSKGWRGAQSCVVVSRSKVSCFDTWAEADAWLGYVPAKDPLVRVATAPSCSSGYLCLYEYSNGGGRRLQFRDEYWQYLNVYGFDRQTSSWRNTQSDSGHLSLYNRSTVYNCPGGGYVSNMGSYNDQAYAVWG